MSKIILTKTTAFVKQNERKKYANHIANKLYDIGEKARATRMRNCSNFTTFVYCEHCGHSHTQTTNLCRDRLCPICGAKLAHKRCMEMIKTFEWIFEQKEFADLNAYFMTLTVKNVKACHLDNTIMQIMEGFKQLCRRKNIGSAIGWARNFEITYNRMRQDFHPHMHAILIFDKNTKPDKELLRAEWMKVTHIDYYPQVDVEKCYNKSAQTSSDKITIIKDACTEAAKYLHKATDVLKINDDDFADYVAAIKGHRFTGYGGIIKKARAAMGMIENDSIENLEENPTTQICSCGANLLHAVYHWSGLQYRQYSDIPPMESEEIMKWTN